MSLQTLCMSWWYVRVHICIEKFTLWCKHSTAKHDEFHTVLQCLKMLLLLGLSKINLGWFLLLIVYLSFSFWEFYLNIVFVVYLMQDWCWLLFTWVMQKVRNYDVMARVKSFAPHLWPCMHSQWVWWAWLHGFIGTVHQTDSDQGHGFCYMILHL